MRMPTAAKERIYRVEAARLWWRDEVRIRLGTLTVSRRALMEAELDVQQFHPSHEAVPAKAKEALVKALARAQQDKRLWQRAVRNHDRWERVERKLVAALS